MDQLDILIESYKELCNDACDNDIQYQLYNLSSPYHQIRESLSTLETLKKYIRVKGENIYLEISTNDKPDYEKIKFWLNGFKN